MFVERAPNFSSWRNFLLAEFGGKTRGLSCWQRDLPGLGPTDHPRFSRDEQIENYCNEQIPRTFCATRASQTIATSRSENRSPQISPDFPERPKQIFFRKNWFFETDFQNLEMRRGGNSRKIKFPPLKQGGTIAKSPSFPRLFLAIFGNFSANFLGEFLHFATFWFSDFLFNSVEHLTYLCLGDLIYLQRSPKM